MLRNYCMTKKRVMRLPQVWTYEDYIMTHGLMIPANDGRAVIDFFYMCKARRESGLADIANYRGENLDVLV